MNFASIVNAINLLTKTISSFLSSMPFLNSGALGVSVLCETSRLVNFPFIKSLASPTTSSGAVAIDDLTIDVTLTTGFVAGAVVVVISGDHFYVGKQIGAVAGSTITVDTPFDYAFPSGSVVFPANDNLAVDGSGTTQIFQIGPVSGTGTLVVDITRVIGYLQSATAMDDAKFAGITALTNGIVLRRNNGIVDNLLNAKSNSDLALSCFDFDYTSKAPAGSFGARFRNAFCGEHNYGVTIRLEPGDTLELLIQDDLSALETFRLMAQGHVADDEL